MRTSTGTAIGPARSALMVIEAFWTWYKRNWRSSAVSSILSPLLFLIALGFGFGSQVRAGDATLGLPYVQYLAPALVCAAAMQTAAFESTFPVLSSFKWQRNYIAVTATPIGPKALVGGVLAWIAVRLAVSGAVFMVVAALLGALTGPAALLALPVSIVTGMAMAAPIVAYSSTIETEGQQFNAIFRFIVMPMMMFSGTFFPVEQLPGWAQPVVWATPLWHGTELARGLSFGGVDPLAALGHTAYLLALFAAGAYLCTRTFTRRLAV
ncbi:ABC transporter permease [Actinokineospora sp. UTMC 2448]|uniref:ABC transporter permease n=1 Tax=Actinokineospora sp. UTMC 2448 TaxID=2268449 RepID=UPI0021FD3D99|nr:ABC transporter permease [Actinokineospora sp. UTMC 2448]UVS77655.1 inner membrane transport permease [Actinokineospora sp. UTMC 2448]